MQFELPGFYIVSSFPLFLTRTARAVSTSWWVVGNGEIAIAVPLSFLIDAKFCNENKRIQL
jgi:hypothetical protein